MQTDEGPRIQSRGEFVRRLREARVELPPEVIRAIYDVGRKRCDLYRAQSEERVRTKRLREIAAQYSLIIKRATAIRIELRDLITKSERVSSPTDNSETPSAADSPQKPSKSSTIAAVVLFSNEPILRSIETFIADLESRHQKVIDMIHPSLVGHYDQRWEYLLRQYSLPRLGHNAPRTFFLLAAYEVLDGYYNENHRPSPKRLIWSSLHEILRALFNEWSDERTLEELIRSKYRHAQRKPTRLQKST